MMIDLDLPNIPRQMLWHLLTYHPACHIRKSASKSSYHVKHGGICSICELWEDSKHAFYRRRGIEILFDRKPIHYDYKPEATIRLVNAGKWEKLDAYFP